MSFFRDLLNFFKYNRSERRAIIVLIVLIFGSIAFRFISNSNSGVELNEEERLKFKSRFAEFEKYLDSLEHTAAPRPFQIDTANRLDWLKIGLAEWQIDIIENYQEAGGKLKKPVDITNVYGIDGSWYEANKKYLLSSSNEQPDSLVDGFMPNDDTVIVGASKPTVELKDSVIKQKPASEKKEFTFELNSADESKLKSIRGIGEKRASIILNYRNALGGFYSLEQIDELYAVPVEVKLELKSHVFIDTAQISKLSFANTSFKDFMRHPYLDYFFTKLLFEASSKDAFEIESIRALPEMSDSLFFKLKPYLSK